MGHWRTLQRCVLRVAFAHAPGRTQGSSPPPPCATRVADTHTGTAGQLDSVRIACTIAGTTRSSRAAALTDTRDGTEAAGACMLTEQPSKGQRNILTKRCSQYKLSETGYETGTGTSMLYIACAHVHVMLCMCT